MKSWSKGWKRRAQDISLSCLGDIAHEAMETFEVGMLAEKQGEMPYSVTMTTLQDADSVIRFRVRR